MRFQRLLFAGIAALAALWGAGVAYAGPAAPQVVIGAGTAASCQTEDAANALGAAVAAGGDITFNCGNGFVEIVANTNATDKKVTVDGGGKIALSGDDARQLFFVFGQGDVTLTNISLVDGNSAAGGAIYVGPQAKVTIRNTFLTSNVSNTTGGAIYNQGQLLIEYSALGSNIATQSGGGIYNDGGTVTVRYTTLISNQTAQSGGAIYSTGGPLVVQASSVRSNIAAGSGGGILMATNTAQIANTTFASNRADQGGGLYNSGVTFIRNATFFANRADLGGGVFNAGETHVKNSILAWSQDEAGVFPSLDCDGPTLISEGRNIIGDNSCVPNPSIVGDLLSTDPLLGVLGDNGGPTRSFEPLEGSPAIDAGDDCEPLDQRGISRPIGLACDIGSIERGNFVYLPFTSWR